MVPDLTVPDRVAVFCPSPEDRGLSLHGQAEDDLFATVVFDGESGVVYPRQTPNGIPCEQLALYADRLTSVEEFAHVYLLVSRRAASGVAGLGLLPHELPRQQRRPSLTWLIDRSPLAESFLKERVHPGYWNTRAGWFAEGASPTAFGTLFVQPGHDDATWRLFQVGLDDPLDEAEWNDREGLARLAARCAEDPDLALTVRALEDADAVRESAERHRVRLGVLQARQAFAAKSSRVKPRLLENICSEAVRDAGVTSSAWVQIHDLRPYDVFGAWGATRKEDQPEAIYAAVEIRCPQPMHTGVRRGPRTPPPVSFEELATEVQQKLDERKLGTAFLVRDSRGERIFVAKSPDVFRVNLAAFDIDDTAAITTAHGLAAAS